MKIFIACILFLASLTSYAQKIEIGAIEIIHSEILQEEREYWIYLPEHYSDEKYKEQEYPIIYLLDGEKYFHVVSGIVNNFSSGYYPIMPECIVVAIKNTNRARDLTPTTMADMGYESGGSSKFEYFITKELMAKINGTYRTMDYKILMGHSFGGLFTMNALFKKANSFNAYVAIDPSLWWDDALFVKGLGDKLHWLDFDKRTLFLANANSLGYPKKAGKQDNAHFKAKEMAIKKMNANIPKNLNLNIKTYPEEDHGSVVLPSIIDAFRFIFKGYRANAKEVMKNPALLRTHYQEVSDKLGFDFKPQCAYIDGIVDLLIERHQLEKAEILHHLNMDLYPTNKYLQEKFD